MSERLSGVIAAIATPIDRNGEPDTSAFVDTAQYLLENGCNGLNVLGTTGEATSFSTAQRLSIMATAGAKLPVSSLMVGIGAASVADAVTLAVGAKENGFGGALVLPPFYYKSVPIAGIVRYFSEIIEATTDSKIPLYLYNFPALTGILCSHELVSELVREFGSRIAGLKDSSGDMDYSRTEAMRDNFDVFPSDEAVLTEARNGVFAGCISATANVNSKYCSAAYSGGDAKAQETANSIRALFSEYQLVPAVKSLISHIHGNPDLAWLKPPLCELNSAEAKNLADSFNALNLPV